jgi:hypothetical protein
MKLVKDANCTCNEVARNLQILEEEGIIASRYVGRRRIIRLNYCDGKTIILLEALKILNTPIRTKQPDADSDCFIMHPEENRGVCA